MSAAVTSCGAPSPSSASGTGGGEITYVSYGGEQHLPLVMSLVDAELSEPYSIFTYRYFVYLWPQLTFLAFDAKEGKCVGTVVCKMGEHRGAFRGYIAMLVVLKPYRGRGIATELVTRSIRVMMESGCEEVTIISIDFKTRESLSCILFFISTFIVDFLITSSTENLEIQLNLVPG
ncbi:hypothetical protein PVAP13_8NG104700 [Panicum virgatum]|uniref:N-acetyltransferase domain-containing protein n=1 Tax=Panicum virgatum TaxID=38727 RepID=A0A8T0PFL3_PANVG|nr:hypothetical protein PVAP13_8NG104700 [Panicum virgatum]